MKTIEYDVKLPDYTLPYFINGDDSGLNDDEIELVKQIEKTFELWRQENNATHYNINYEEESYFGLSEFSRLWGNVIDCTVTFFIKG